MTFEALRERFENVGIAAFGGEANAPQETFAFPQRGAAEGTVVCMQLPGRVSRIYCFFVPRVTGPLPGRAGAADEPSVFTRLVPVWLFVMKYSGTVCLLASAYWVC